MNEHYISYVELGKKIANDKNINWHLSLNAEGLTSKEDAWNLTEIAMDTPPPTHRIRDFGYDTKIIDEINKQRKNENKPTLSKTPLTTEWQDLIKAAILEQLLIHKNTTGHIVGGVVRPLRVLATCMENRQPWELRMDDVLFAYETAKAIQPSGKLADMILGIIKVIIDTNHISNASPLYPTINIPRRDIRAKTAKYTKSQDEIRQNLIDRKSAEKLPERRAFWELIRIVFTEKPNTFLDMLRFAQAKVLILCGLRIGEVSLLPSDWKRTREYTDYNGKLAGELGGYSKATMLRHFAEKQQTANSDSISLYENTQFIPDMFVEILSETLDNVMNATQPLRDTLRKQVEQNRILPWYNSHDLIPAIELYPYLTGNPIIAKMEDNEKDEHIKSYLSEFNPSIFTKLHQTQLSIFNGGALNMAIYIFYNRMKNKITFRDSHGSEWNKNQMDWRNVYLRTDEVEIYIKENTPTKISDTSSFRTDNGVFQAWELMFLMPKRALSEGRNDGLCDVTRYFSVGRADPSLLQNSISGTTKTVPTLFEVYSQTEEDKELTLTSHSLRHLQNTELFRLGVADTIISKRFNRRSVAQSYEYDHRQLAEELDHISIPEEVENLLGEKAATVAKMIKSGKANGPIVDRFKRIQDEQGDDAAFEFLKAEADGFHSTPYGHCLNSFTVDPCPKHLECFAGCRHLTASNLPENRQHLIKLEERLKIALETAESRPANTIGRKNQIEHAQTRLQAVRTLLRTPTGQTVFSNGIDLYLSANPDRSVLDDDNLA